MTRLAESRRSGGSAGWRVFLSSTSELRDYPRTGSYVAAAERAIAASGHVIVDMADIAATDQPPSELCADRVQGCDVFVGLLGTRYGSPVRDRPEVSYSELEFEAATEAGLPRLVFLLDTNADVGIPPAALIDWEFGTRQEAFRRRVQDSGMVARPFPDPATLGQLVERALRELAAGRGSDAAGEPVQSPAVVVTGEIPREPPGFQPRADLMAALDAPGPPGSRAQVVHVLTGMRGVGKTQLAAAYARAKLAEGWRLVAWINAEDPGQVLAGLGEVASALGLVPEVVDSRMAGRAVRNWLEAAGDRCLVVFDDATDPGELLPFLPAAGTARVIITSNQQAMASLGSAVSVDVFTSSEALTFLAARTGRPDAAGAEELAAELGGLPLALAQAAAVIAAQRLSYGVYLDRLGRVRVEDLLRPEAGGQYPRGVAEVVLLWLEAVRSDDEVCGAVMDLMSVLSAAGVPRALLHAAGQAGALTEQGRAGSITGVVDEALGRLAGSSLLTFDLDGEMVTAHRLVLRVIRERLAAQGRLIAVCEAAVTLLQGWAESLLPVWRDRLGHRNLVEQIMAVSGPATGIPEETDSRLTQDILALRALAVSVLIDLGDRAVQAVLAAETLLPHQDRILGREHRSVLACRGNLAIAYRAAGRVAEAITLHEHTLTDRDRILGLEHPDTLSSRNGLANAYRAAGRAAEAVTLHEETLIRRQRILGPDHLDTLSSQNNLANAYQDVGRTQEAITLHERTLTDRERILGPDHPDTADSRNNLANAYLDAGRMADAITLHERTLRDREVTFGPDHPDSVDSKNNLANAYRAAGRTEEAVALYERTLADRTVILGPDHPDIQRFQKGLAAVMGA